MKIFPSEHSEKEFIYDRQRGFFERKNNLLILKNKVDYVLRINHVFQIDTLLINKMYMEIFDLFIEN